MKSRFTILIVGLIAVLSWWLLSTEQKKQSAEIYDNHFIDVFINNFTLTSTDRSGETAFTLHADRLEHYNDEDHSQIINPSIRLPQNDNRWLINAEFGEIDNQQSFITLRDNVTMKQIESDQIFVITTQAITIDTKSKIIKSDQEVNIQSGSLKLKSNGIHFDNQQQQLKLLSNVSGIYAPR